MRKALSIALLLLLASGCGEEEPEDGGVGAVDASLVGAWEGTFVADEMSLTLRDDGSFEVEIDALPAGCEQSDQEWGVKNGNFLARFTDECDGVTVNVTAPYSVTVLDGEFNWGAPTRFPFRVTKR